MTSSRVQPFAFSLFSLITIILLQSGCSDSRATPIQSKQPYYHTASGQQLVSQQYYQVSRTFIGQVQARQNAQIGFEQNGKVARLFVSEGEKISKGSLLAQQDIELLNIERLELDAQLQQNNADLSLVNTNLKRLRSLKKRGFTSEQSLDELQAQRLVLSASAKRLNASIAANELRIGKASLYAPFDAVIGQRLVDSGEVVAAGAAAFTLLQQGSVEVKIGVPVDVLEQLSAGQHYPIVIANKQYTAMLLTIGSDVNPVTRTVQLRFTLDGPHPLVNGQLAQLNLQQKIAQQGFWIPLSALTDGQRGMWNIYSLQQTAQQHIYELKSHNAQVHYTTADKAFISADLADKQQILSHGLHRLVPGQQVKLAQPSQLSMREPN